MTSTKDEASNDLHQAIELERLSRVAGDDANKLVTTQVAGQLLNVDSRLSTEIVHRVEGDLGNLKELNSIAAALNKYKVELGSELTNESISRDHLGIELSNSISSATAYFDHSTFLLYQAIQTAQDEYRKSNESMDARIKKYENMLQDITTDSIQITTDNGELRMGAWTILSQARQWDLDIMSKLGTLETKNTEDLNQALQELQDRLPIEQDIIDKAIEQLSNAPIIKELDELLGSSIERIEDMDLALVNEAKERASQMLALAQQQIDASKELAALIKAEIEEEHAYLIEAQVKEASIRAAEIKDKADSLRVEVDQALTFLDTHVNTNIDKVSQLTEDLRLALIQENKDRLAAIALLDDGLTAEIKQRKDGDTASIQAINNYKSSNDTALANVRESISTVATNNSANAQRISALDSRLGTAEQSVANATSTAESAVTATTALASQVDALSAMITDIEEGVETTVDVYAFNALKIRVDSAEGNIKTNTTNITTLTGTVKNLGTITSATNEAVSTLQTNQEITDGKVSQASSDITLLKNSVATVEAELDTKVDSLAYAGLESTVSKQGTAIDSQSKDIVSLKDSVTTITGSLSKKAESSALTALTNRVTTAEGSVKSHGESITALNNSLTTVNGELAKKATSAAVASLTSTVNDTKGELSTLSKSVQSLTGELDTVEQDLATKASVSALDATTAEVKTIKGNVTTNTDKISVLENDIQVVNNGLSTKLDASAITNYYTKGQADNKAAEIAAGQITEFRSSLTFDSINLLKNTEVSKSTVGTNTSNQTLSLYSFIKPFNELVENAQVGEEFTWSFKWSATQESTGTFRMQVNLTPWVIGGGAVNVSDQNLSGYYTSTFKLTQQHKASLATACNLRLDGFIGSLSVWECMFQRSSKVSPWVKSPIDFDSAIDANATAISKTDARVTQVDGKVTTHTSQISKLNSDVVSINGALATKANSSALQGLASEATVNASIAAATTALNASLGSSGTNIFKTDMANVKEGYMEASRLGNSDLSYWSVVDATDAASGKALQYSPKGQPINTYTELSPLNKTVDPNGYGSFNLKSNTHYLFSCYVTLVKAPTSGMFSFGFSLKYQAEGTAVEYVRQLKASVITAADLGKRVRVTVVIKTPERLHEERRAVPYIHSNMSRVADGTVLMDSFMLEEILNYDDKATHKPSSFDSVGYETFQAVTANANALDVLKTNVSNVDGKVISVGNRTTTLENSVNNATTGLNTKASSSALNTLDNRVGVVDGKVTTTNNNLTQLTGRVSTVENGLTSKADVSALSDIYTKSQTDAKATEISAGRVEEFKAELNASGVNLMPHRAASLISPFGTGAFGGVNYTATVISGGGVLATENAFRLKASAATTAPYLYFPRADIATAITHNKLYVLSAYVRSPVAKPIEVRPCTSSNNSTWALRAPIVSYQLEANTWTRVHCMYMGNTAEAAFLAMTFYLNKDAAAVSETNYIEVSRMMIEEAYTKDAVPSVWREGHGIAEQVGAAASAVEHLTSQVTQVQGTLTSVSGRTTNLENAINNTTNGLASKASSQALTTLNNQVQHSTTGLSAINTKVDSLKATIENTTNGLASKASSSALDTLANKVNHSTTGLDAVANKTTQLESQLDSLKGLGANLTDQGDFEHLTATTGMMQAYTAQKYNGTRSMRFVRTAATGSGGNNDAYIGSSYFKVAAGRIYYLEAYVRKDPSLTVNPGSGAYARIGLNTQDEAGNNSWQRIDNVAFTSLTDTWTKVSGYITVSAGHTKGRVWFSIPQEAANLQNSSLLIDAVFVCDATEGRVTAGAVDSLTTRVSTAEGRITTEAGKVTTLQTEVAGNKAAISVQGTSINGIKAEYTIKTDVNGLVSGIGLINDGKSAAIGMNADYFYIGKPSNGKKPFLVTTSTQTINGVSYPAGTWIDVALIANATIGNAHIADASITNAKIKELDASKITTGTLDAKRIRVGSSTLFDDGFNPAANLQEAKSYVDAVEIGGVNTFASTTPITSLSNASLSAREHTLVGNSLRFGTSANEPRMFRLANTITEKGFWTVSGWVKGNQAENKPTFKIDICDQTYSPTFTASGSTAWVYFSYTVEVTRTIDATYHFVDFNLNNYMNYEFKDIKVEKGSKASAWTPAPSDLNSYIDTKAKTFTTQPVTPYTVGDLWRNGSAIYVCTTARATGNYTAGDWTLVGDVTANNKSADTAKVNGVNASTVASNAANGALVYADVMSDLKITPVEKTAINQEWNRIQKEYASLLAQAQALSVTTTAYTSAYTGLSNTDPAMSTILTSMSTTTTLTAAQRDAYKTQYTTYYTQAVAIIKAINDKIAANAKSAVDNIQIGGTNLYTNTREFAGTGWNTGSTAIDSTQTYRGLVVRKSTGQWSGINQTIAAGLYPVGTELTLSFYAKGDTNGKPFGVYGNNVNNIRVNGATSQNGVLTTSWVRQYVTFTISGTGAANIRPENSSTTGTVFLCGLKLEVGNKASEWTPAPEDVDAAIETKSKTFTAQPVTPYTAGDLWKDGTTIKVCTVTRTTGSYTAADWILVGDVTSANTAANSNQLGGKASSVVLNDITGAKNAADAAASKANSAETQLALWKYPNTTYIDGGKIYANSITANQISAAAIDTIALAAQNVTIYKDPSKPNGERMVQKGGLIQIYDANNKLRVKLGLW